jgi:hypothetical protein
MTVMISILFVLKLTEAFGTNSLEQLLINYANERLQQQVPSTHTPPLRYKLYTTVHNSACALHINTTYVRTCNYQVNVRVYGILFVAYVNTKALNLFCDGCMWIGIAVCDTQFNLFVFKLEEQEFKSEGDSPTSTS